MRDLYTAFAEAKKLNKKRGFTLIELLVVIAIIAILAAIAIPQFAKYRIRAFNGAAESDLRNVRTTLEAIYADFQEYGNADIDNGTGTVSITHPVGSGSENVGLSNGVYLDLQREPTTYQIGTVNEQGDRIYCTDADSSNLYWKSTSVGTTNPGITSEGTAGTPDCSGFNVL